MKKSEKEKYTVKPDELLGLLSQVNKENGFMIPVDVSIRRNDDLRLCLQKLLTISPNLDFTNNIECSLSKLEDDKENISLHISEFCNAIHTFQTITENILNVCKDSFAVTLTTLKIFQMDSLQLS